MIPFHNCIRTQSFRGLTEQTTRYPSFHTINKLFDEPMVLGEGKEKMPAEENKNAPAKNQNKRKWKSHHGKKDKKKKPNSVIEAVTPLAQ